FVTYAASITHKKDIPSAVHARAPRRQEPQDLRRFGETTGQRFRKLVAPAWRCRQGSEIFFVCRLILKERKPDKHLLALAHGQGGEVVHALLSDERRKNVSASLLQHRRQNIIKKVEKVGSHGRIKGINCSNEQPWGKLGCANWRQVVGVQGKPRR